MFDFHKAEITNFYSPLLLKNNLLDFVYPGVKVRTGELISNKKTGCFEKTANYYDLIFLVKNEKYFHLSGSFHKYYNNGEHNHNDYNLNQFVEVLISLAEKFNINPFSTNLHNLEFGVNVTLPFPVKVLLNAIISYKGKDYNKKEFKKKGYLLQFEFDQYYLKIYDKGMQYRLSENILRFEISVKKMEYFNSESRNIGINNYANLLNPEKIQTLSEHLLRAFNELIIYDDSINLKTIDKESDRVLILNGRNPKYWSGFETPRPKRYSRHLKRFRELNLEHGTYNLQKQVCELIKDKLRAITYIDAELQVKINNYLGEYKLKSVPVLTDKLNIMNPN